jgi:hypothetical protein
METAPCTLNERIKFIVLSVTGGAGGSCCKPTRKQKKYFKQKKLHDFMFCTPSSTPTIDLASIGISVASSLGAAVLASGSLSGTAAIVACLPIVVPITNALVDAGVPIGEDAKRSMAHLTTVNSLQLSFGLVEFLTGDVVNGFTHMLMAGIGFYVVHIDGIVLLPTYSVASTVFASVSVLNLVEMILYKGLPENTLPMTANFLKLATISHPFLYMASAFLAWTLIDQLRTGLLSGIQMNAQNNISGANMAASLMMMEPTIPASERQPFTGPGFRLENPAPPSDT